MNIIDNYLIILASPNNLTKLKGRPIITAHSWITSNPFISTELDTVIDKFRKSFLENNLPLIVLNNTDHTLNNLNIPNITYFTFISFYFSSLYTNITQQDTNMLLYHHVNS